MELNEHQKINLELLKYYEVAILARPYAEFGEIWLDLFYPNDGESNIYKTESSTYLADIAKRCGTSEDLLKTLKELEKNGN